MATSAPADDEATEGAEQAADAGPRIVVPKGVVRADRLSARSGKSIRLMEMLEELVAAGDRALIFTQYRQMGHLLVQMIRQDLDVEALFLHGGTPQAKREQLVQRFQSEDPAAPIFVLSLKAGGVGLNLTAANHVFHYDRWWNPAVENQATDRAFRIGQMRTVNVHKMITVGTLEERIDQMIEQKTELASQIIGSGEQWLTELNTSQLRDLLSLRGGSVEEAA
jgi:SNF2 family DNA or RNA helicase